MILTTNKNKKAPFIKPCVIWPYRYSQSAPSRFHNLAKTESIVEKHGLAERVVPGPSTTVGNSLSLLL